MSWKDVSMTKLKSGVRIETVAEDHDGQRIDKTVHYYLMEVTGGDLADHDHEFEDVAWFDVAEAEALLRSILEAYPEQHEIAYSLGLLLAEVGRYEEAAVFLERAAAGMPDHPRVHHNLREIQQYLARVAASGR